MDFTESHTDDAQSPPDAEVTHRMVRRNARATLSTWFHDARCSGAPSGVWELTHGEGLNARR